MPRGFDKHAPPEARAGDGEAVRGFEPRHAVSLAVSDSVRDVGDGVGVAGGVSVGVGVGGGGGGPNSLML